MLFEPGDTFQHRPGASLQNHLNIILCHNNSNPASYLRVNITSYDFDTACILDAGDHPFITHRSYVYYRKATITEEAFLRSALQQGLIWRSDPLDDEVLWRIQEAALNYAQTPSEIKEFLQDNLPAR